jgi:hypothetical protein
VNENAMGPRPSVGRLSAPGHKRPCSDHVGAHRPRTVQVRADKGGTGGDRYRGRLGLMNEAPIIRCDLDLSDGCPHFFDPVTLSPAQFCLGTTDQ